jgi:hypothetical protein
MHNIEAVDPSITKRSVRHLSKLDREVFDEFRGSREALRALASRLWDQYSTSVSTNPPEVGSEISRIARGEFQVGDDTRSIDEVRAGFAAQDGLKTKVRDRG